VTAVVERPRPRPLGRPTLNVFALRAVLMWIERNPHLWDQNQYLGSSGRMCLAGWTCVLAGHNVAAMLVHQGPPAVFEVARGILGLSRHQAAMLFHFFHAGVGHPSVEDLRARVRDVTGV
jgi:hypothetical protein